MSGKLNSYHYHCSNFFTGNRRSKGDIWTKERGYHCYEKWKGQKGVTLSINFPQKALKFSCGIKSRKFVCIPVDGFEGLFRHVHSFWNSSKTTACCTIITFQKIISKSCGRAKIKGMLKNIETKRWWWLNDFLSLT